MLSFVDRQIHPPFDKRRISKILASHRSLRLSDLEILNFAFKDYRVKRRIKKMQRNFATV